jgi:uncharacterized protein YxjI
MLDRTTYLVRERVGFMKLTDTYDILDAKTGSPIGIAREKVSAVMQLLRVFLKKHLLPTRVEVSTRDGEPPLLALRKRMGVFRTRVDVLDAAGELLGWLRSKLFSFGGGFHVFDASDAKVAEVKGDWKGWNFKLVASDGRELGTVTKKWAGIAKELFTSADNYVIHLADGAAPNPGTAGLLLASGLAIDVVFKER